MLTFYSIYSHLFNLYGSRGEKDMLLLADMFGL